MKIFVRRWKKKTYPRLETQTSRAPVSVVLGIIIVVVDGNVATLVAIGQLLEGDMVT